MGTRTVTCVLYLNRDWTPRDGGELLLYTDPNDPAFYEIFDYHKLKDNRSKL